MTGLITDIAVLRELLNQRVPEVCQHLEKYGLPCAVITTKWFICIFAEVLPIETVLRIWDCLFLEGSKVRKRRKKRRLEMIFLYSIFDFFFFQILFRVCLTLFVSHKDEILECDDISALANLFRNIVKDSTVTDCHQFMESIFRIPGALKRKEIERLRQISIPTNSI